MRRSVVLSSIALLSNFSAHAADQLAARVHDRQCIVVVTDSWTSTHGTLRWFERESDSDWGQRGGPTRVVLGRAGLAWGRSEMPLPDSADPIKREGDDKAPAGIFRLGTAFGYAAKPIPTRLPYLPLSKNIVAVDDSQSGYYNRLIDVTKIKHRDWKTAEIMGLSDQRYTWGVFVRHNDPPKPGAGSCIFLHVWLSPSTPTSGCTAMAEPDLRRLIGWLDPAKDPRLIQLPRSIYDERQSRWNLPNF